MHNYTKIATGINNTVYLTKDKLNSVIVNRLKKNGDLEHQFELSLPTGKVVDMTFDFDNTRLLVLTRVKKNTTLSVFDTRYRYYDNGLIVPNLTMDKTYRDKSTAKLVRLRVLDGRIYVFSVLETKKGLAFYVSELVQVGNEIQFSRSYVLPCDLSTVATFETLSFNISPDGEKIVIGMSTFNRTEDNSSYLSKLDTVVVFNISNKRKIELIVSRNVFLDGVLDNIENVVSCSSDLKDIQLHIDDELYGLQLIDGKLQYKNGCELQVSTTSQNLVTYNPITETILSYSNIDGNVLVINECWLSKLIKTLSRVIKK